MSEPPLGDGYTKILQAAATNGTEGQQEMITHQIYKSSFSEW